VTVGRELVLLSGVFDEPHVASWLQEARRKGDGARAVLKCKGITLGRARSIDVRFQNGAAWQPEQTTPVARVMECQVVP
jgi:hypothetical protein